MRRDNPASGIELEPSRPRVITPGLRRSCSNTRRGIHRDQGTASPRPVAVHGRGRKTDAVALGPSNMRNGRFIFTASKNDADLDIPVAPPLAATIAATPMIGVKAFLVTEYGKPFTAKGFGNWFRDRCDEAGLPQCTAHGLRKAFLRRWPRLDAARILLPRSAATRTCARSGRMCRPPTRRRWRPRAWRRRSPVFLGDGKSTP